MFLLDFNLASLSQQLVSSNCCVAFMWQRSEKYLSDIMWLHVLEPSSSVIIIIVFIINMIIIIAVIMTQSASWQTDNHPIFLLS